MESKFSGRIGGILRVSESDLLPLHFDDVFEVICDLSVIEGSDSDHDLDTVCHVPLRWNL